MSNPLHTLTSAGVLQVSAIGIATLTASAVGAHTLKKQYIGWIEGV